jgi:hypothetical protein
LGNLDFPVGDCWCGQFAAVNTSLLSGERAVAISAFCFCGKAIYSHNNQLEPMHKTQQNSLFPTGTSKKKSPPWPYLILHTIQVNHTHQKYLP